MSQSPANDVAPQADASEPSESLGRVLVVDDNEQNRELLLAYLEELPVETVTADDGVQALEQVDDQQPDVILLDIMMPRMSGYEVCKRLKSRPDTRDIPIIMVTALNEISDIERASESGTNEYISKPVKKVELIARVKNLLEYRRTKRDLDAALEQLKGLNPEG